jgi:hypothetical protein
MMHAPPWHVWLHTAPHAPQLFGSVDRLSHAPPHEVYPGLHADVQLLLVQAADALAMPGDGHACAHVPQLSTSVVVFTHELPHVVGSDAGHVHAEAVQTVLPVHAKEEPQPPQLLPLLVTSRHWPVQSV